MRHEQNYWVDQNHNKWSTSKYTKKQAARMSQTLVGCTFNTDCMELINCHGCVECNRCIMCVDCIHISYQYNQKEIEVFKNEPKTLN